MIPFKLLKLIFIKKNQLPVYLIHSITEECNAKCSHCFVKNKTTKQNELSAADIAAFCPSLGDNLYQICLSGGEPFLRDDLIEIAQAYVEKTPVKVVQISTNGFLTDKITKMTREMLKLDPRKKILVNLSLDGLEKQHDKIRGLPGLFHQAVATYSRLNHLQTLYPNLILNVNVTASRSNENDLINLYNYLTNHLKVQSITITKTRGEPRQASERNIDLSKYIQFSSLVAEKLKKQRLTGYHGFLVGTILNAQNIIARQRIAQTLQHNHYIAPCFAGQLSGTIQSDGSVFPCELLKESLGNLKHEDFQKIWLGPKNQAARKKIKGCFCTHECFLLVNILFYYKYLFPLLKEALKMEFNRRFNNFTREE